MPERRTPTAHDLAVWRDFVETGDRLRGRLSSRLQAESDLSSGDYAVLLALSEASGRSIRSSELAAHIDWERSRLSHHLGRMEARGLVTREKCETDNRGAEVALTEHGARLFRRASASHLRAVRELFVDALTAEQLDAVGVITAALRERLTDGTT